MGGCLAPMNAFLNFIGMDTLGLRMDKICSNTLELAKAVDGLNGVTAIIRHWKTIRISRW